MCLCLCVSSFAGAAASVALPLFLFVSLSLSLMSLVYLDIYLSLSLSLSPFPSRWLATVSVVDAQCDDADADGFCGGDAMNIVVVRGCMATNACNFDPRAVIDTMDCSFPEPGFNCNGHCLHGYDAQGQCMV